MTVTRSQSRPQRANAAWFIAFSVRTRAAKAVLPLFLFFLLSHVGFITAQCTLVCKNTLYVSVDGTCAAALTPEIFLSGTGTCPGGNLRLEMQVGGQWQPFAASAALLDKTTPLRVRDLVSSNQCSTSVLLRDVLAPAISVQPLVIPCLLTDRSPAALAQLGVAGAWPDVADNCGGTVTRKYVDELTTSACVLLGTPDYGGQIRRTWTVTDARNNVTSAVQIISLERKHWPDVVFPKDITLSCQNANTAPEVAGTPYIVFSGKQIPLNLLRGNCDLSVTYSDQRFPLCDGSYNIMRQWLLYDWCSSAVPSPFSYTQTIRVVDVQPPVLTCPPHVTINTDVGQCARDWKLPDMVIEDGCSRIRNAYAEWAETTDPDIPPVRLNAALRNFTGNNPAKRDTLAVMGVATALPVGTTLMTYGATDDCENTVTCTFQVTVQDKTAPTALCNTFHTVSLNSEGTARLNATVFNRGSYDNCRLIGLKVRRERPNACQSEKHLFDFVQFCCQDAGDTVAVSLRVFDGPVFPDTLSLDFEGYNYSECSVRVFVQEKLPPRCVPPPNVTVSCQAFDRTLTSYGQVTATDNCSTPTVTVSNNFSAFDSLCRQGTVVRTFQAKDRQGQTSTCTQTIQIVNDQYYFVRFPDDVIVTACGAADSLAYGKPTFEGQDCEVLATSYKDQRIAFSAGTGCYIIERTWRVVNWCTYDLNKPCINIPNPNPETAYNAPANLSGPTVSAANATGLWASTVSKISVGDAAATDFSTFWRADANCYTYTQYIRIVDAQLPTVDCPTQAVTVADSTDNDPKLWATNSWLDPKTGLRDLPDAPTRLCITATDACSKSDIDIQYQLSLDLDANGTLETVVRSNPGVYPPAGALYYNNATQIQPTGGELRLFDNRALTDSEKYTFGMVSTPNGDRRTACVRWVTAPNATTPATWPQLPYGTHRIRWSVRDACGNLTACEYPFTVADGKKPTLVCKDGLSVTLDQNKRATVQRSQLLQQATDNYTAANALTFALRKGGTGSGFPTDTAQTLLLGCTDVGVVQVEVWARDAAQNADRCVASVRVDDLNNTCTAVLTANLLGRTYLYRDTTGVAQVQMRLVEGNNVKTTLKSTDTRGNYQFNQVTAGKAYSLIPYKNDNPINGVTTFDLALINKHLLSIQPITDPLRLLAADANRSNSITAFDVVELRKLILGLYDSLPNSPSWRFVPSNYIFPNPQNPFVEAVPDRYTWPNLAAATQSNLHFYSVKVGDVDGSALGQWGFQVPSIPDDGRWTHIWTDDVWLSEGVRTSLRFQLPAAGMAFQGTLHLPDLLVTGVEHDAAFQAEQFAWHAAKHAVTVATETGGTWFTLWVKPLRSGWLHDALRINDTITPTLWYDGQGQKHRVQVYFRNAFAQTH